MPGIGFELSNDSEFEPAVWLEICEEVLSALEEHTPVHTGFCRDSWNMSFSTESTYFYNNCEYASYLDEGWSSQAPSGIIPAVLQELSSIVNGY